MWEPTVTNIPYVRLGGIKFRKNDFFLARPNADNGDLTRVDGAAEAGLPEYGPPRQMWFGKVLGVVVHSCWGGEFQGQVVKSELLHVQ